MNSIESGASFILINDFSLLRVFVAFFLFLFLCRIAFLREILTSPPDADTTSVEFSLTPFNFGHTERKCECTMPKTNQLIRLTLTFYDLFFTFFVPSSFLVFHLGGRRGSISYDAQYLFAPAQVQKEVEAEKKRANVKKLRWKRL